MSSLKGIIIEKGALGVNIAGNQDAISALVVSGLPSDKAKEGAIYELRNITDAYKLGIDDTYDKDNNINVYRHIKEFYRMAREGTLVFLSLVKKETPLKELIEKHAKPLLSRAEGKVRQIAFASQAPEGNSINGLPEEVMNAIASAQGLARWAYDQNMPCHILLEGRSFSPEGAQDLKEIQNLKAPKVSVVIAQDWNYAEGKKDAAQKFADVGTALGALSKAKVNQNLGEVKSFNLTDATVGAWLIPGLSNHQKTSELTESLQSLEDKGYILALTYSGVAGARFNNDHVCAPAEKDASGNIAESSIAYSRTLDKATRGLRAAYLMILKSAHPLDPKSGKLPPGVIKYFESIGQDVLNDMIAAREISGGKTWVDPQSDLLVQKTLSIGFSLVPYGSVNEIKAQIHLKTQL